MISLLADVRVPIPDEPPPHGLRPSHQRHGRDLHVTRPDTWRDEMSKKTKTAEQIEEQVATHGIEFGERYRDPASGFEGEVQALYFYKHACLRVALRGVNRTTGEPAEFTFDAPELVHVASEAPVPAGKRTGGPHGLIGPAR